MQRHGAKRAFFKASGQGLFVLLAIIVLFTTALIINFANPATLTIANDKKTAQALAEAKAALIGYAATYPDTFPSFGSGFLPCPDTAGSGSPNQPCGPNAIGRFPDRYLGVSNLRDGSGERLWYALSDNFRDNPKTTPLNSGTPGQLNVTGTSSVSGVIAIIFAPGPIVANQVRDWASQNTVANYLENANIATGTYTTGPATDTFNDRLMIVTRQDLLSVVAPRIAREIQIQLDQFHLTNSAYPYAAATQAGVCQTTVSSGFLPVQNATPPANCPGSSWPIPYPNWLTPVNQWEQVTPYTRISGDKVSLQFTNCASVFTLTWYPLLSKSNMQRSGPC